MPNPPAINPNVEAVPKQDQDPRSLPMVVRKLREGFESLAGQRGADRAVLFSDLLALGIIIGRTMNEYTFAGSTGGSGGSTTPLPPADTGIPEAPMDGFVYGRMDGAWVRVLALSGGTMTGPLILSRDPQQDMEAVTKRYADYVAAQGNSIWDAGNSNWDGGASQWDKGVAAP